MRKYYSTLLIVITVLFASAQQPPLFTIHGHVINQETGAPVIGQSVLISIDSLQNYGHYNNVVTDANGEYSDYVPYMSGVELQTINVFTYDCRGAMVKGTGYFHTGKLEEVINLSICGNAATQCEAFFKFSPNPNNSLQLAFYNGSLYLPASSKISYAWSFGDSTTSNEQNPIHIFNQPGIYSVCLSINSGDYFCSSTVCLPVSAGYPTPGPCENSFWYYNDSTSNAFVFNGWVLNGPADTWKWDFGDGTMATGQTVTHSFSGQNTSPKVCLTTTGAGPGATECTAYSCQDVYLVHPLQCESSFSYYPDSSGSGYIFEGYAKNNQVSSWIWDFQDGTTATGQKVSHSFSSSSDTTNGHFVCLTTTGIGADSVSCTFSSCQEIYIYIPSPCENYFKANTQDGSTYIFSGSVASGAPASYFWDFGDGTSATGQIATHSFENTSPTPVPDASAAFNVCLTTISSDPTINDTCKSISCKMIFVAADSSICKAVMTAVNDSAKNTHRFFNLSQSNYTFLNWDFGDGGHSAESNPVHTYTSPGIYFACLTISDTLNNCKDQVCQEIWVDMIQPSCQASFAVIQADSSNSVTSGYLFFNTSAPGYTNQKWSFGDGTGSIDFNPVHVYDIPGIYTACLTIWDTLGKCQSNYCTEIYAGKFINDNTIAGIVLAGNKVADKGIVWLVSPENNYNAELFIDSTGIYHFTGVPYGWYYIYAMLTPGSDQFFAYMPTYYASSLSWQGATLIHTGEPNAWYALNLVPSMAWSQGDATITGTINWGGMILKAEGNPAANVEVVLYNSSGNPIAYTFTDSNGTYIFEHLPYGDYTVQAEMTGKSSQSIVVYLTENAATININFVVNGAAIDMTGITEPIKPESMAGSPFPNPVSEILNLRLNTSASGTAVVDIIDVQGRIIHTEPIALTGSNNLVSIATGSLTKGIYMLRVKSDGYKPVLRKFIK
ncbi:MAG: PKD domain-containing protein [Bacteroidales bacterium]|nr:PKD domain-containing protein [Bacteroidales bacterium]